MRKLLPLMFIASVALAQNPQAIQFPRGLKADSIFSLNSTSILFRIEQGRTVFRLWDDSTVFYPGTTRQVWVNASGLHTLDSITIGGARFSSFSANSDGELTYRTWLTNPTTTFHQGRGTFVIGDSSVQLQVGLTGKGNIALRTSSNGYLTLDATPSASNYTLWFPLRNGDSIATKQMFSSMAYSDSTWWWNKRDTASSLGVPTINRMLDSLADIRTSISALPVGVSSVFGRTGAVVAVNTDYSSAGITNTTIDGTSTFTGSGGVNSSGTVAGATLKLSDDSFIITAGKVSTGLWNGTAIGQGYVNKLYLDTLKTGTVYFGLGGGAAGALKLYSASAIGYIGIAMGDMSGAGVGTFYLPQGFGGGSTATLLADTSTGNGIAGNMAYADSAKYRGSASITTLGTIGTGTWQGTSISTTYTAAKYVGRYFFQAEAPGSPVEGDIWVDEDASIAYLRADGDWRQIASW